MKRLILAALLALALSGCHRTVPPELCQLLDACAQPRPPLDCETPLQCSSPSSD